MVDDAPVVWAVLSSQRSGSRRPKHPLKTGSAISTAAPMVAARPAPLVTDGAWDIPRDDTKGP